MLHVYGFGISGTPIRLCRYVKRKLFGNLSKFDRRVECDLQAIVANHLWDSLHNLAVSEVIRILNGAFSAGNGYGI